MGDDLEARLKGHQRAFEGLMSLIPAKDYYGKDESITSTEWTRVGKKQSKADRQAAKRAKLDPANHKSALDVMDENARKRKRELDAEAEGDDSSDFDMGIEKEKPSEGLRMPASKAKKQKTTKESDAVTMPNKETKNEDKKAAKEAQAKAKAERKQQQQEKKKEKQKEKQAQKQQKQQTKKAQQEEFGKALNDTEEQDAEESTMSDAEQEHDDDQIQAMDVSGLVEEEASTATPSAADSTASVASAVSSSSSMPPPTEIPQKKEKKSLVPDQQKHDDFRARLQAKLDAMRAARKADGPDGRPAKNRAELIEARRKKEAERKAAKKAQRQLAQEDEERLKAEEQLARIRGGSGSPSLFSHRSSPDRERNLSFGRVAWNDGNQLEGDLSGFRESKKQKGRSDAKTALEAAKNKQARLNALDEEKRKDIQEKDLWLNAKKRAQGERVHDDPKLLKKSVKRLDKAKAKSSREWSDRKENVQKGQEAKQKKREQNLQKRREEKGSKGKKKVGKAGKKIQKRAGFEGRFKAK